MPEWCCGYVGRRHVERSFGGSNLAVHRAYRHAVRAGPCGALVGSLAGAIPPLKTPTAFATQSSAGRGIATNTATEPGNTATNGRIHFMDSNSRLGGTTPPTNVHDIPRDARDARRRRTTVFGDRPAQSRRNRCEMSMNPPCGLALPVPHSSSLDFTAERNQTKGRSREIHWFGVDGGTCGPDFTDAVRPDRRQPSRLRRRSGVDDVVDPNSLRDDRGAGVARRRGARTARCFPRCFRRTRRVRLCRRSRSGSASRRRARCPIRHSYYPSCCLCEHRRLLGPCHVSDSLRWCRCAERRA